MDWQSIIHETIYSYSLPKVACDACTGRLKFATKEVGIARRLVCSNCEFQNSYGFCKKCGCKISWKSALAKSRCPLGKWEV